MSLPKRIIVKSKLSFEPDSDPDVAQRQLALSKLENITFSLMQFSQFAQELFQELEERLNSTAHRINSLDERIYNIRMQQFSNKEAVFKTNYNDLEPLNSPGAQYWKVGNDVHCNFFTKQSENLSIRKVYENCNDPPALDELDQFRTDDLSTLSFYSYPQFFVEEWKRLMEKESQERKEKKRHRKRQVKMVSSENVLDLPVKKYNTHGEIIQDDISQLEQQNSSGKNSNKSTMKRNASLRYSHSRNSSSVHSASAVGLPALPKPLPDNHDSNNNSTRKQEDNQGGVTSVHTTQSTAPPPPPPPPQTAGDGLTATTQSGKYTLPSVSLVSPMPSLVTSVLSQNNIPPPPPPPPALSSSPLATPSSIQPPITPIEQPSSIGNVGGGRKASSLFEDIVQQQQRLKKVDPPPSPVKKFGGSRGVGPGGVDVAAILMRRVALEMSDSEVSSDGGDDVGDDDWE